jgi:hypothetical protein
MGHWEPSTGASNEWYTPKHIADALGCVYDLDVAAPVDGPQHIRALRWISTDSLVMDWAGFIWMNAPFEGRNGLVPWLDKFFAHGDGVALTPDRTSAPWWQAAAARSDLVLFIAGKPRFVRPDGTEGKSPSNGISLLAAGERGVAALHRAAASGLGFLAQNARSDEQRR